MNLRASKLVSIDGAGASPLVLAAAVLVLTLFTWSLAVAAPLPDDAKVWLARGDVTGMIPNTGIRPSRDGASESEAALFSAPMTPPRYGFDRLYRYELNEPRTRVYVPRAGRETN